MQRRGKSTARDDNAGSSASSHNNFDGSRSVGRNFAIVGVVAFKFRRQSAIRQFVADFICYEARLIVEVDGDTHNSTLVSDRARTEWFERQGHKVIRNTNTEVRDNLEGVWEEICTQCIDRKDPLT